MSSQIPLTDKKMKRFKRLKNYTLYTLLSAVLLCGCKKEEPKKKYKHKIEYGGFTGGWYKTNDYKIENGYYIFECNKDSIKLKETLVDAVITNNNY